MLTYCNFSFLILTTTLFLTLNLIAPLASIAKKPQTTKKPQPTQQTKPLDPFQTLVEADKLYLLGKKAEAEKLYRQVKTPFATQTDVAIKQPITDPEKLSSAGKVYWRNVQEGVQKNSESQILVALKLLIEKQPEFIPGYQLLAEALQKKEQKQEAIEVLEKGVTLFPESAELTKSLIKALHSKDKWLEASITARQFTIVYPQHPESPEFLRIADQDLGRFNDSLNKKVIVTGTFSVFTGILTGQGTATALNLAPLILQGESGMGSQLANSQKQQLRLVEDPAVVEYVNTIGKDVAKLMGRNFQYEFYVAQDDSLNAFALPGGKIFVNTGTILACNSEAELAGVIAHEVSHSVLSHGFEKIVNSILLSNLSQTIPLGDLVNKIAFSQYSQEQERQADILGARALANAGYAADGLHNFMVKLNQKYGSNQNIFASHPATTERISYLEQLIVRNGYNRYSYEGVEKHAAIQKRLR